ncbi:retinitis pigmentosa 1-like 1 protein [Danio aesculapii]|uniref:retinitis pigmentosa 1-like 1 protein n=1 Tax=Danio aesculapii TaxID=1142201 RepID=UPI0024C0C375|nr:retinitis pigmentosa 1-like 1 protein [Danio aesculapii]
MQRAAQGSFDADPHFHNDPHQFPHPPTSSFGSIVTASSPVKRITFYKSGDAQFKGVKMAVHKRTFKCFDALLDDLSQKVPLPFGVRTITTPRGTHSIKHLEQFEDGGCYLCSDRRYVKPINMEEVGKRQAVWHNHSHSNNTRRKPSRPDEPPSGHHHHHHRHPKRIILVKNSDPAVRRSIILSRRTARSLRVFTEEISELMQCHVKKLYTLEGRKIDSIQSLMQCPSVLVCVGREPFRPLLMESLKKLSDEKLPGVGTRSHSSICSEGHESKKNVNFGLETKKSIIHPRSDSSNRSTRFSLSSEKSYQNGLCMTPGQSGCVSTCPYVKEVVMNDDIEKRVLVNKDGSLSVEMKVRFRLFNDETLQWSTEIKKSSMKVNESGSVKDTEYLQAKAEYSDPDSVCASEAEEAFATKKHLEETLCQNCCNHCQEYDIWKNPMHKEQGACKSPSSSGSSQKITRKKSSVDSTRTISRSSGEYLEHVVEKATCFQETMEEGDTRVEYCSTSHCCSRSEVSSAGVTSKSKKSYEDGCGSQVTGERPISAVSNSSKVLESLKEDQDDDYDDLPPSVSRASNWSQSGLLESDYQPKCAHCCGFKSSPQSYLSPIPPSKETSTAIHSLKVKKHKTTFATPVDGECMSTTSPVSKVSSMCHACHCRAITPCSVASGQEQLFEKGACSNISRHSQASCKSRGQANTSGSNASDAVEKCDDAGKRSVRSGGCSCCGESKGLSGKVEEGEPEKADSILSKKSVACRSDVLEISDPVNNASEGEATQERSRSKNSNASSTSKISKKSNCSAHERCSGGRSLKSEHNEGQSVEERTKSAMSAKSDCIISQREPTPALVLTETDNAEEESQERAVSPMSVRSNLSPASRTSHKSISAHSEKAKTPRTCSPNDVEEVPLKLLNSQGDEPESAASPNQTLSDNHYEQDTDLPHDVRSASAMSNKSNQSSQHPSKDSKRSVKSCCELQGKSPDVLCKLETEERQCRPLSNCSKTSVKSKVSSKHSQTEAKSQERVPSAMSAKTNASKRSCGSCRSNHNIPETTVTSVLNNATTDECATSTNKSKRPTSPRSQTSEKSYACSERSIKSETPKTTLNALTVTSPLPRKKRSPSPRSTHNSKSKKTDSRAASGMSENSNVSQRSGKCNCLSSSNGDLKEKLKEDAKDESEGILSGKSDKTLLNNIKSSDNQFDEPVSPTSTASVSLGLGEDQKGDDFDERSTSGMSEEGGNKLHEVNGVDAEERPKTEASVNSDKSKKSHQKTPVQALSPVSAESVMSAEFKKSKSGSQLNENNIRVPSTLSLSSSRSKSPSRVSPGSAKNTVMKERDCKAVNNTNHAEKSEASSKHEQSERAAGKGTPASDCLNSSKASECSVKSKNGQRARETDKRSKHSSHCLEMNGLDINSNRDLDDGKVKSLKTSTSDKRSVKNDASRPNSAGMSDISQSLPLEMPNKKKASVKHPDSSSESVLSRALSAADLLREIVGNARPVSRGSKSVASSKNVDKIENKSQKSSRSKHSHSSEHNTKELMPSCLPNASPTEVVNDWLRNIPIDGYVYEMDVEHTEREVVENASQRDKSEAPESIMEVEEPDENHTGDNHVQQQTNDSCVEIQACDEMDHNPKTLANQDSLQKQCDSSVQVMKVLLGPKLDRSSSLPEVSPVYGRKLSQSAQGLLDCLANLRLIDSDSKDEKHRKYNEVMMILQSLWLQKPIEDEHIQQNPKKNQSAEDEFNLRYSSGVDVNSGSTSSVKGEKIEASHGTIPPIEEQETSLHDKDDEEDEVKFTECLDPSKIISDPVTPDIAERTQGSPVNTQQDDDQENDEPQEEVSSSENKNESDQTPQTTSYKSSGNESYTMKSPENTSSGTPPSVQRAALTKRVSQDPDPVWVLSLLKKLEKQFMLHYTDAMAEFKVRWDLDDNEMLNTMITELKEEVHKRIQSSINRELQKIQSRTGRGPRPPGNALSRESTAQTEQRRKRLRVMRNKSILTRSDEDYTASGTENSDQRSDDEYCPCDACIKKKLASRAAQRAQALSFAPVIMEFDLRKILQMKKDPVEPPQSKPEEQCTACQGENNLEVVHEEVEEVNDDTRGRDAEMADQEETDGAVNAIDATLDSDKIDQNDEEANNKSDDVDDGQNEEEGESSKEEMVVNDKGDDENEEEVDLVEEDTEKEAYTEDAPNIENSDSTAPVEKEDEMTENAEENEADDKQSTEEQSTEDVEESNKDVTPETTEGETPNEESTIEKSADGTSDAGQDDENPKMPKVKIEMEVRESAEHEEDKFSSVEEQNDTLAKQATKTSTESQPGSMENCTAQAKLKDLQSFMESLESHGDSVVITKQPPYKEPHEAANQKDMCNGLTEWQVSPKMNIRANKQKNQKNGQ